MSHPPGTVQAAAVLGTLSLARDLERRFRRHDAVLVVTGSLAVLVPIFFATGTTPAVAILGYAVAAFNALRVRVLVLTALYRRRSFAQLEEAMMELAAALSEHGDAPVYVSSEIVRLFRGSHASHD